MGSAYKWFVLENQIQQLNAIAQLSSWKYLWEMCPSGSTMSDGRHGTTLGLPYQQFGQRALLSLEETTRTEGVMLSTSRPVSKTRARHDSSGL
jgi:hypothetical protein